MDGDRVRKLLGAWHEFVDASESALDQAGHSPRKSNRAPTTRLAASLVAELTSGVVDPAPDFLTTVITATGKSIGTLVWDISFGLQVRGALALDYAKKNWDELAMVALSDMRPYAVHFLPVERLAEIGEHFGQASSTWSNFQGFGHDTFLMFDFEMDSLDALLLGVKSVWLDDLELELDPTGALDRARIRYNNGGSPISPSAQRVVDSVLNLERRGQFRWVDFGRPYGNMAATLLETILLERGNYATEVVPVVNTALDHEASSISQLLEVLAENPDYWSEPFCSLRDESARLRRVATALQVLGAEDERDIRSRLTGVETGWRCKFTGLSDQELAYLQMLSGAPHRSAGGRRIRAFIEQAGVPDVASLQDVEVEAIIVEAAGALGRTPRELDHSIWLHVGKGA